MSKFNFVKDFVVKNSQAHSRNFTATASGVFGEACYQKSYLGKKIYGFGRTVGFNKFASDKFGNVAAFIQRNPLACASGVLLTKGVVCDLLCQNMIEGKQLLPSGEDENSSIVNRTSPHEISESSSSRNSSEQKLENNGKEVEEYKNVGEDLSKGKGKKALEDDLPIKISNRGFILGNFVTVM